MSIFKAISTPFMALGKSVKDGLFSAGRVIGDNIGWSQQPLANNIGTLLGSGIANFGRNALEGALAGTKAHTAGKLTTNFGHTIAPSAIQAQAGLANLRAMTQSNIYSHQKNTALTALVSVLSEQVKEGGTNALPALQSLQSLAGVKGIGTPTTETKKNINDYTVQSYNWFKDFLNVNQNVPAVKEWFKRLPIHPPSR